MAMTRTTIEATATADPRFKKLRHALNEDDITTIGVLYFFWFHTQNAELVDASAEEIMDHIFSYKDRSALQIFEALVHAKYISANGDRYHIHGNEQHVEGVRLWKKKCSNAGKASGKARRIKSGNQKGNEAELNRTNSSTKTNNRFDETNTVQYSSLQYNSVQEKEESAEVKTGDQSTRVNKLTARGAITEFSADADIAEKLKNVTHNLQTLWLKIYPDASWIIDELKKALVWIAANPKKAPKDFGKFMSNWLGRGYENYRKTVPTNKPQPKERTIDL